MKRWSSSWEEYLQPLEQRETLQHITVSGGVGWMIAVTAAVVVVVAVVAAAMVVTTN